MTNDRKQSEKLSKTTASKVMGTTGCNCMQVSKYICTAHNVSRWMDGRMVRVKWHFEHASRGYIMPEGVYLKFISKTNQC